jgi:GT2 family glycosyltransferase/glycosyltransferase involved in cell wall biosynthesis
MRALIRFLLGLPLLILCPVALALAAAAVAIADLVWVLFGKRQARADALPDASAASVVIPNWNGRELLERYLPSVVAALDGNPGNEIVVVDNGSTDGSAAFLRERFPEVRLVALDRNHGFGGGANAGVRAAGNGIVVLLNNDMRVEPDFLAPLLAGFRNEKVFAVSCQIFFGDPNRRREETGLTQGCWRDGALRLSHRIDNGVRDLYPCFYGGGGSCAFDRRKFLELGGFDPLLRPFYLEDADLGFLAWKRGWQVLYQPASSVIHEHRGTIGRHFTAGQINAVYQKNYVLFAWKNIHDWRKLAAHFGFALGGSLATAIADDCPLRASAAGIWRAFLQLPQALASRWRARRLATVSDTEAFLRPLGGYFRDRFQLEASAGAPERPSVLFVSPYPLVPPTHGGAVFMSATVRELARLSELHLVCMLEHPSQREAQQELARLCASAEFLVRGGPPHCLGSWQSYAVREFANEDFQWLIDRQIYTRHIDVVQIEYTHMAQYAGRYRGIATVLFEHDIYFQSIARSAAAGGGRARLKAGFEYLRTLRYELGILPRMDRIQVCSRENKEYLASFLPKLENRTQTGLRAGIDTRNYCFHARGREPFTMLFLGSFRHPPNRAALGWFVEKVLPLVTAKCPVARLVVVGSEMPGAHSLPQSSAIELRGAVDDAREPLGRYSVFVCPVLSGSGVRVKLLEAFAAGIPAVSTTLGAEGLTRTDGELCALANDPAAFAGKIVDLFLHPERAVEMAEHARREVEAAWDIRAATGRLLESYREALEEKRGCAPTGVLTRSPLDRRTATMRERR